MKIKSIKKINNNKYQIIFDNNDKITTYDEVLLKDGLLYKKELSVEEINNITKVNNYYDVYSSVIKYISKKIRSEKEIKTYISKYDLSLSEKNKLIETLKQNSLINDRNFIRAYVYDKIHLSADGPIKIKNELLKHDLKEADIDEELSLVGKEELKDKVSKLITKKLKIAKGSSYVIRRKIFNDLCNLGYSVKLIEECYNYDIDDQDNLKKDYEKIYRNVIKKETDLSSIGLKIKQKLYQKGYKISEIDNLLREKGY